VWFSILSEKAEATLDESSYLEFRGRALQASSAIFKDKKGVSTFLSMLDEVNDLVTSHLSSSLSHFQNEHLFNELHRSLSNDPYGLWRLLSPLFRQILSVEIRAETAAFLRQQFSLLAKLGIDRKDLLSECYSDYFQSEFVISAEASCQRIRDPLYWSLITDIRALLKPVVDNFIVDLSFCKHGPGAVSDPCIKDPYGKYCNMAFDARLGYLIRKNDGGLMSDFSPYPLSGVCSRSSRVIYVPKTWKKLRGISAEPVELMYFQQGVYRSIETSIRKTLFSQVINLRDQNASRMLALSGSKYNNLVTIDLSSASDSVTLQLVKDVFGSSSLTRWLLATRSTHTVIDGVSIELSKFAPMGSACCFPVECLIFAAVTLATAHRRSRGRRLNLSDFQIFGDDIICPASISEDLIENLTLLGFSVNKDKTFLAGDFRESCGMDAWRGCDITPLKLRDISLDLSGGRRCSYENFSRFVSYLNSLFDRGYLKTRRFLLNKFFSMKANDMLSCKELTYFSNKLPSGLSSFNDDNPHLPPVSLRGLQRSGLSGHGWRPKVRLSSPDETLSGDMVRYHDTLMTMSQRKDTPVKYDLEFFKGCLSEAPSNYSKPLMVPKKCIFDVEKLICTS
jgi:hypothetical protein